MMKARETPEEKRLRHLKKKEAKERKRKEKMGWDNDYLHYTNTDNPFGDGNLLSTFVWSKKLQKEGLLDVSGEELEIRNRHKQEENKRELEKVKKRRQVRELERQQREKEMTMLQRGKEAAQLEQWARQENQFHLEQARLRSHSQATSEPSEKQEAATSTAMEKSEESQSDDDQEGGNAADDLLSESFCEYESGGYFPKYIPYSQLEPGTLLKRFHKFS